MTEVLVNLDDEFVVEHLLSDKCEADKLKPCGFSEHVMYRVVVALREKAKS